MALCALASRKLGGRPVKWTETRSEHMHASAHGNERTFFDTRVALDKNGVITAIDSRHVDDCGAYPALRAARLRHLGAGSSRRLSLQKCALRFFANRLQQMPRGTQSRLFPHAASLVPRARDRYLRSQARLPRRRNAHAQLHSQGGIPLHHAQRLRLRFRRLRAHARHRQKINRLGQVGQRTRQSPQRRPLPRHRHRQHSRFRHE